MKHATGARPGAKSPASPVLHCRRRCRVCGCTEASACRLPDRACAWVLGEAGGDLCDAPSCIETAAKRLMGEFRRRLAVCLTLGEEAAHKPDLMGLRVCYNRLEALLRLLYKRNSDLRGLI